MLQVLITGKISQAVVVAAAAYRNEAAFRERTGIEKTKLIIDEFHTNTHVSPACFGSMLLSMPSHVVHLEACQMFASLSCVPAWLKSTLVTVSCFVVQF